MFNVEKLAEDDEIVIKKCWYTFSDGLVISIVPDAEVVEVEEIRTISPIFTVAGGDQIIPLVEVELAVRKCPFVPTGNLDLDEPSLVRMSPLALIGLRLISYCVGIINF
jgi:hypothetical protein